MLFIMSIPKILIPFNNYDVYAINPFQQYLPQSHHRTCLKSIHFCLKSVEPLLMF